jgi:hypothetical protein
VFLIITLSAAIVTAILLNSSWPAPLVLPLREGGSLQLYETAISKVESTWGTITVTTSTPDSVISYYYYNSVPPLTPGLLYTSSRPKEPLNNTAKSTAYTQWSEQYYAVKTFRLLTGSRASVVLNSSYPVTLYVLSDSDFKRFRAGEYFYYEFARRDVT